MQCPFRQSSSGIVSRAGSSGRVRLACRALLAAALTLAASSTAHAAAGTAMTYQGQLKQNGAPLNGHVDLQFHLYDGPDPFSANYLAGAWVDGVRVVNGLFTADLDFGATPFSTVDGWVEVWVLYPAGAGGQYVTLEPRQRVAPAPYAIQTRGIHTDEFENVGIGTVNPEKRLQIGDQSVLNSEGMIRLISRSGNSGASRRWDIGVPETDQDLSGAGYSFVIDDPDAAGTEFLVHWATGNVGIGTATPVGKLDVREGNIVVTNAAGQAKVSLGVNGSNGVVTSDIVVINGGSDIAEPYDVAPSGDTAPQPGMVVSIDPAHVGKMRISSRAYDRTVAGIISGANGIQPGLTLAQKGTIADGAMPVANVGRVWCYVDADAGGAVAPGDLLTTSDTPGHAMRVGDHSTAGGAILGKAMSSLDCGRGMVLVLVSLQ